MHNFLTILTKPDNLPIAAMFFSLAFLLWVWIRQALHHDRLIAEGRRDELGPEMRK